MLDWGHELWQNLKEIKYYYFTQIKSRQIKDSLR